MSDDKKRDDYAIEMGERKDGEWSEPAPSPRMPHAPAAAVASSPVLPVLSYCGSSILMTVTNKYVLSGSGFNLNFFLLCVQSVVCVIAIQTCKTFGVISYRDFNSDEAKKCELFPCPLCPHHG